MTKGKTDIITKPTLQTVVLGDGKTYTLSPITLRLMSEWDGISIGENAIFQNIEAALYVRLKSNHPDITIERCGELIDTPELMKVAVDIHNETTNFILAMTSNK